MNWTFAWEVVVESRKSLSVPAIIGGQNCAGLEGGVFQGDRSLQGYIRVRIDLAHFEEAPAAWVQHGRRFCSFPSSRFVLQAKVNSG